MKHLEQSVYDLISFSFIRLDTVDQQLMRRFGLTLTQSWALVHLGKAEGRSLSELAHLLMCDKSNVTGIVDRFEEDGLAFRERGKDGDRRYTRVVLTENGHQLRRRVMQARAMMVRELFGTLDEEYLHTLQEQLQALASVLKAQFEHDEENRIIEDAFEQGNAQLSIPLEPGVMQSRG